MSQMFPYQLIHERMKITEIQDDIENIVLDKVEKAFEVLRHKYGEDICVICDDVGLEIAALNNLPGPYIKYFLKIGVANFERIVRDSDNTANAVCALGICFKNNNQVFKGSFVGRTRGKLVFDEESYKIFGFDGFFLPEGANKTYSRMSAEEKNRISHRHIALAELYGFLSKHAPKFTLNAE